ncbi:MAG: hypothetical protein F7B18_07610 [Desulfurococcales archaeon]|nr:hypothetical protein [Desulfurococcales archaeon]
MYPARARLHPYTGILLAAWGTASTYTGCLVPSLLVGLGLLYHAGVLRRLLPLYAWVVVPVTLAVGLGGGPGEGLRAGAGLLALVSILSASMLLLDPLEAAYSLARLGLPLMAGLVLALVLRSSEYMGYAVYEARAGLYGRGLRGIRLLLSLPGPLVVHAFNLSSMLGEALYFKYPGRGRSWYHRPRPGMLDYLVALLAAISSIACYMGHFSIL